MAQRQKVLERIICRIDAADDLSNLISAPDHPVGQELIKLGFTNLLLPGRADGSGIAGIGTVSETEIPAPVDLADLARQSGSAIWSILELKFGQGASVLDTQQPTHHSKAALMLQMSTPLVPVVPIDGRMIPGRHAYVAASGREFRELFRSLTFWRTRFHIVRARPRLVHADDSRLLIYVIDSWLVVLNLNESEEAVDIGQTGAMWLMLGTDRDVHLHGSLLVLPAGTGAILANELAQQGGRH